MASVRSFLHLTLAKRIARVFKRAVLKLEDGIRMAGALHAFRGSWGMFAPDQTRELARSLEVLARPGSLDGVGDLLDLPGQTIDRLELILRSLTASIGSK